MMLYAKRHIYTSLLAAGLATHAYAGKALQFVDFVQEGDNDWTGLLFCYDGAVSNDNKHLYVVSTNDNKVSVWERNQQTGMIAQVQLVNANVTGDEPPLTQTAPSHVEVSADDKNVYVAAWAEDLLFVYTRDTETGELTELQQITDPPSDGMIYFTQTSDSRYIIGACWNSSSAVLYERDPLDGTLSLADREFSFGLPGTALQSPIYIKASPDNKFVYTADYGSSTNTTDGSITILSLDTERARIGFEDVVQNNAGGVRDLGGPRWLDISSDGNYLYATGLDARSVVAFSINKEDGSLAYLDSYVDEVKLDTSRVVSLSPDGTVLMANGYYGNTVFQFDRNPATGLFTLQNTYQNEYVPGALGFAETRDIVFSKDGSYVYLISWGDSGITTMRVVESGTALSIY